MKNAKGNKAGTGKITFFSLAPERRLIYGHTS